jgi:uridylate kinase
LETFLYNENMNKILIKLSGEALSHGGSDYNQEVLDDVAIQVKKLIDEKIQVALVLGGGNLFRGKELIERVSVERPTADYIGMLAIVQNALVLRDFFESQGIETRVSSAISMQQVCEPYIPKRIERHLQKGRVVILAAGLGQPYFSSDSTCVQRALELGFDTVVMAKNGVDGVYTSDPNKDSNAVKISEITASEVLEKNLTFADPAAISLARENGLELKVIGMADISRVIEKGIGTKVLAK